jgi:phosphoglycerate dehydrogenase-like enzyme
MGSLWAAGLDDWPTGYQPPEELIRSGRLVVTAHIGGSTKDARAMTEAAVVERMEEIIEEALR